MNQPSQACLTILDTKYNEDHERVRLAIHETWFIENLVDRELTSWRTCRLDICCLAVNHYAF